MRIQNKVKKAVTSLEFFTSHQWEFTNDNLFMIMKQMNEYDAKVMIKYLKLNLKIYICKIIQTFNLDVKELHWPSYIEQYCLGAKKYVLKEEMTNINKARRQLAR